ncbi:uncharacterized protein LOC6536475 [Drosophila yakuba]|uniref:MD-2-related lipid-recognition domain-containing protein n=1 Tax=Drosophila yakuba TaxID=7245 RepID=B4PKK9_DROYA|nr:uncharacterized protein LOC6536475 [Drosophila yakuba]EDW96768.2 uncharacterized protein Dyak_GE26011 [Drosophila yakuba]
MRLETNPIRVWSYVVIVSLLSDSNALFKFKNIKCTCYEKSFCELKRCELKVVGRGIVGLYLHAQTYQLPIKSTTCILSLYRRFNGYRPFLYNVTVDICSFLKNRKRYPFFDLVYDGIRDFTNVNHSCPFNHDIIVHRMVLNDNMIVRVPVPSGFYKLMFVLKTDGIWRGEVEVHVEVNLGYDR